MEPALKLDELHVISDLHLGGAPGFQIFGSTRELQWLIEHLTTLRPGAAIGLLINGDFVDFLAEAPARHFDAAGALDKLERIATDDPTFQPVFSALAGFLRQPGRQLIVNLGNHDIELALPWVRRRLVSLLTSDVPEALARLHLVMDGTGALLQVGTASVLCLHGNEVDRWNVVDYERLRQIGRDAQLGRPLDAWVPNPGSALVIDVMNHVKIDYPFVDLLKPELEAVVPTLAACGPAQMHRFERQLKLANAFAGRLRAQWGRPSGLLGDEVPRDAPLLVTTVTLRPIAASAPALADELLREVERDVAAGVQPRDLVATDDGQLGTKEAVWAWATGKPTAEVLRQALDRLDKDRSFETTEEDDTFRALAGELGRSFHFLVTGHTHLERSIWMETDKRAYFNSGTWVRLIKIQPGWRADAQKFDDVFKTLQGGTMAELDAYPGLIIKPCTVVSIVAEDNGVVAGELRHVRAPEGVPAALTLVPDAKSRRERRP